MNEPMRWVKTNATVRAFDGTNRHWTIARGRVIAYQENPMVLIEDETGERTWWAAHLCEASTESNHQSKETA